MGKIDLRKKPQGPPGGLQPRVVPGLGRMPFKTGDTVLTPQDRKNMEALGVRPGDPVPPGLAGEIARVRAEVGDSLREFPKGRPAGPAPEKVVDISSLPPARQKELRDFVAAARLPAPAREDLAGLITPGMDPSVADAVRKAAGLGGGEGGAGDAPKFHAQDVMGRLNARAAATAGGPAPGEDEGGEEDGRAADAPDADERSGHCPRCRWALDDPRPPAPTPEDRAAFVAAVLGSDRFVKSYPLFGGRLTVAFRSLPTRTADLVLTQLARDRAAGRVADRADQMRLFWDYRLCLSLLWLRWKGEGADDTTDVAGAVDEALGEAPDDGEATGLPRVLERLQESGPLAEETVWRAVSQVHCDEFQATVDGLEFQAGDPSF